MIINPSAISIWYGLIAIFIGVMLIIDNVKQKDITSPRYFLLDRLISEKTNRLINLVANILIVLLGISLILNENVLKTPITISLFFIILGTKTMTGTTSMIEESSGRSSLVGNFFNKHLSEKTNRAIGLLISILIMSLGIGILVWHLVFN